MNGGDATLATMTSSPIPKWTLGEGLIPDLRDGENCPWTAAAPDPSLACQTGTAGRSRHRQLHDSTVLYQPASVEIGLKHVSSLSTMPE